MNEHLIEIIEDSRLSFDQRICAIEKALMTHYLEKCNWIKLKAARAANITYRIFNYKYEKYGLDAINPRKRRKKLVAAYR